MVKTYEVQVDNGTNDTGNHTIYDPSYFPYPYTTPNTTSNTYYYSSSPIYLYQIICPKPRCKTSNWLQLDHIKECKNCGSTLKAVMKRADYEVEVG